MIDELSVKLRLLLVAVAASLPLMVLLFFAAGYQVRDDYTEAQKHALEVSQGIADRLDDYVSSLITVMQVTSHSVFLTSAKIEQNKRHFEDIKADLPRYVNNIKLNTADGRSLGSSSGLEVDIGDRDYFLNAVQNRGIGFGEPKISRSTGEWTLTIASALLDDEGEVRAVLSISTDLLSLNDFIGTVELPEGTLVTVLDSHGHVVTRNEMPEEWIGQDISYLAVIKQAILMEPRVADGISAEGVKRLGASVPTAIAPWVVYAGIPSEVAFDQTRMTFWTGIVALLSSILIGMLAASYFGRRIAQPLRALAQDARAFGDGDLKRRSSVKQGGEIGELAGAFNQMAERLRDREQRNTLLEQASPMVIWDRDVRSNRETWSNGITEIFGYPLDEVGPAVQWYRPLIHPADRKEYEAALGAAVAGSQDRLVRQYRLRRSNGDYAHVEDTLVIARDTEGKPARFVATVRDVSDRVIAEAQLRQSQKLEAVGQLTGGVAHDFNNLLQVISTALDVLDYADLPEAERADMIAQALGAVRHGSDLTRQLLAFSRQQPLSPSIVELGAFLKKLLPLLRRTLGEQIEISFDDETPAPVFINVDPAQLDSAVMNLALNARDAMPGGGHLGFRILVREIDEDEADKSNGSLYAAEGLETGTYCVLEVSDDGEGMDERTRNRIFEPFFTTKATGRGSGLGLSMVFGFMVQSKGKVTCYSELSHGTTFRLYFKAHDESPSERKVEVAEPTAPASAGGRLLIVEDNEMVRKTVRRQFEALGFDVVEATSGNEALTILEEDQDFILLFSDVVMPGGLDGVALAKVVQERYPAIKILLTSGFPSSGNREIGYKMLSKPYRRSDLAKALNEILNP